MIEGAQTIVTNMASIFGKTVRYNHQNRPSMSEVIAIVGSVHVEEDSRQDGKYAIKSVTFNISKSDITDPNLMDTITDDKGVEWNIKSIEGVEIVERNLFKCSRVDMITKFRR